MGLVKEKTGLASLESSTVGKNDTIFVYRKKSHNMFLVT